MPWSEKNMLKTRENELLPSVVRMWDGPVYAALTSCSQG